MSAPTAPPALADRRPPHAVRAAAVRVAPVVVWGVWAVMALVVLACIGRYGRNVPLAEDWTLVAAMTGNEPDLGGWLWAQNNEHRTPLSRLLLLALVGLTRDFRAGMVFDTLVAAGLAAALVLAARRLRGGRTRLSDAFFPVALLHLGNWENLLWSWQLQFVLSTALTLGVLLVVLRTQGPLGARPALLLDGALSLLPLTGANGVLVALAMAPWAAWQGWSLARAGHRAGYAVLAAVAVAVALSGLYFVGYERASWNPPSPGPAETLKTAVKALALGIGPAAKRSWLGAAVFVGAVLAVGGIVAARALWREPAIERGRAGGLLLFLGAMLALAGAVGWGRGGLVPEVGMPQRYTYLSLPALCAAFFAAELYGPPLIRRVLPAALLGAILLALPLNTRDGMRWRNWYVGGMDAVERDVAAGLPRRALAARHHPFLLHWSEDGLADGLSHLREAGVGPFGTLREAASRDTSSDG